MDSFTFIYFKSGRTYRKKTRYFAHPVLTRKYIYVNKKRGYFRVFKKGKVSDNMNDITNEKINRGMKQSGIGTHNIFCSIQ